MEISRVIENNLQNIVPNTTMIENNEENLLPNVTDTTMFENSSFYSMYYDPYDYYDDDYIDVFGITQYVLMPVWLLGIVGNGGTLWVMSVPPFTNMPHCVLCRALAVVDLLKLIGHFVIAVVYSGWSIALPITSRALCKLYVFLIMMFTHLDAWCIVSLALERLLAVSVPLKMKSFITKGRVRVIVSGLIAFFLLFNAEILYRYDLVWFEDFQFWDCAPMTDFGLRGFRATKEGIGELLATLIPICIMVPCNVAILLKLYQQHKRRQQLGSTNANEKELIRMTIMICSITFAFIALVMPISIHNILGYAKKNSDGGYGAWVSISFGLDTLNFYAYFMSGKLFREKVLQLLGCCKTPPEGAGNIGKRQANVRHHDEFRPQGHSGPASQAHPEPSPRGNSTDRVQH